KDITVYTFLMPLEQLHPQAKDKAVAIWCSNDRSAAWQSVTTQETKGALKAAPCEHPIDRNLALAASLGINGTPTLVAVDGRMKAGALPAEEISAWLEPGEKVSEVRK
ncbi:MAG: DsbC family protein, partial [Gammaproteobacteria bacterium]|nr:DsbC family protein [Gammaproteobacteria bacterium]